MSLTEVGDGTNYTVKPGRKSVTFGDYPRDYPRAVFDRSDTDSVHSIDDLNADDFLPIELMQADDATSAAVEDKTSAEVNDVTPTHCESVNNNNNRDVVDASSGERSPSDDVSTPSQSLTATQEPAVLRSLEQTQ